MRTARHQPGGPTEREALTQQLTFTEQLRRFDDAELDPFQFRLLVHYWRVGRCWETVRTTAEKTGMSKTQVGRSRAALIEAGWLQWVEIHGRAALVLAPPEEQPQPQAGDEPRFTEQQTQPLEEEDIVVVVPHRDKPSPTGTACPSQGQLVPHRDAILNGPYSNGPTEERERRAPPPGPPVHPNAPPPETAEERALVSHRAIWVWLEAGFSWPGYDLLPVIIQRLGEEPDVDALRQARQKWRLAGYRKDNHGGILDWYDQLRADPSWEPYRQPVNGNGHGRHLSVPSQKLEPIAPGSGRY